VHKAPYVACAVFLILLTGCSGKRVKILESRVDSQEEEIGLLQAENDSLRKRLQESEDRIQVLQELISAKDATITEQEESLNDLRLQYLELKASMEEEPIASQTPVEAAKPSPPPRASGDFKADYDRALKLFRAGKYDQAAQLFGTLAQSDRSHDLADNAQYWLGECYYAKKEYQNAIAEFEKVFAFPNSNKADAAQLKIGMSWLELGKYPEAKEQFIRLLSSYPSSEYVPRARALLEKIP
jgi:tol-pal system protein YbgF